MSLYKMKLECLKLEHFKFKLMGNISGLQIFQLKKKTHRGLKKNSSSEISESILGCKNLDTFPLTWQIQSIM